MKHEPLINTGVPIQLYHYLNTVRVGDFKKLSQKTAYVIDKRHLGTDSLNNTVRYTSGF